MMMVNSRIVLRDGKISLAPPLRGGKISLAPSLRGGKISYAPPWRGGKISLAPPRLITCVSPCDQSLPKPIGCCLRFTQQCTTKQNSKWLVLNKSTSS